MPETSSQPDDRTDARAGAPARLPGTSAGAGPELREHLAAARSILANERTFLAYQRTALTELAVAATFIHFFDHAVLTVVGWLLVPASVATIGLGVLRYRRMRGLIRLLESQARRRERGL